LSPLIPFAHEVSVAGVLVPPGLIAAILGILAAIFTTIALNRTRIRLSRHFYYPPLVILALAVIYSVCIGLLFFGV